MVQGLGNKGKILEVLKKHYSNLTSAIMSVILHLLIQ